MFIYDGDCKFCCRCADWLRNRGEVPMAPAGELDLPAVGLTPEEAKTAVWWIDNQVRLRGHEAIGFALRSLRGRWLLIGWLIGVPPVSWIGAIVYRWVAANRHRFG